MEREDELRSTVSQWTDFLKSTIWSDLKTYLADRLETNNDLLRMDPHKRRDIGPGYDETDDKLRGRMAELEDTISAIESPDAILRELEERERSNES